MNRSSKTISVFYFIIFFVSTLSAQLVDLDTLVYPITTKGQTFENYLVSLAWENNPRYKIHAANQFIANKEVQLANRAWADDWNILLNLNENNLTSDNNPGMPVVNANNFPRYNFGLTLNLGSLITRGLEVDIAEQQLEIEQLNASQDKLEIRSEVYLAYAEYNQTIKVLKIVTKQEQNTKDILDLMKTRFSSGSIDYDKFNAAQNEYNRSLESLITQEEKVNAARLQLEALIGIPLSLAKFYYDQNNG